MDKPQQQKKENWDWRDNEEAVIALYDKIYNKRISERIRKARQEERNKWRIEKVRMLKIIDKMGEKMIQNVRHQTKEELIEIRDEIIQITKNL